MTSSREELKAVQNDPTENKTISIKSGL